MHKAVNNFSNKAYGYYKCTECALMDGEHKQCRWVFKLVTISMDVYRTDVADNNDGAK